MRNSAEGGWRLLQQQAVSVLAVDGQVDFRAVVGQQQGLAAVLQQGIDRNTAHRAGGVGADGLEHDGLYAIRSHGLQCLKGAGQAGTVLLCGVGYGVVLTGLIKQHLRAGKVDDVELGGAHIVLGGVLGVSGRVGLRGGRFRLHRGRFRSRFRLHRGGVRSRFRSRFRFLQFGQHLIVHGRAAGHTALIVNVALMLQRGLYLLLLVVQLPCMGGVGGKLTGVAVVFQPLGIVQGVVPFAADDFMQIIPAIIVCFDFFACLFRGRISEQVQNDRTGFAKFGASVCIVLDLFVIFYRSIALSDGCRIAAGGISVDDSIASACVDVKNKICVCTIIGILIANSRNIRGRVLEVTFIDDIQGAAQDIDGGGKRMADRGRNVTPRTDCRTITGTNCGNICLVTDGNVRVEVFRVIKLSAAANCDAIIVGLCCNGGIL